MSSNLPPLNWLRAFEAAARHLSFTQAARELNLTQSAVSQHIRSLEHFLGRELFIRQPRALLLSEVGANYLPTVREAFDLLAVGTRAMKGGDVGQSLTIQSNLAFTIFRLTPKLEKLYAAHPWLTLNIVTPIWDPERHAQHAVIDIRFGRPGDMSKDAIFLPEDRYFPVCRPDYHDGDVDLARAVLLDCAGVMGNWEAWHTSQGQAFDRLGQVHLGSSFVVAITTALQGAGVAMAHDTLACEMLSDGRLVRPFEHAPPLPERYSIIPPAPHAETPASRAVMAWLHEEGILL